MVRSRIGRILLASLLACVAITPAATIAHAQEASPPAPLEHASMPVIEGDPLVPGTTAIVTADDCLRLRSAPNLSAQPVTCIQAGRTVDVLEGVVEADGYRWQQIRYREHTGWAADEFLDPYDGPPRGQACLASSFRPGVNGEIPAQGGPGLVVWGGGTLSGLETVVMASGCRLASVWTTRAEGGFVGYLPGAPAFVNDDWFDVAGEHIAAGTPLLLICGQPGANIADRASTSIWPLPSAGEPARTGAAAPPDIDAKAAVLVDEASGTVLYDLDAHAALPPASLTKIVTAVLALEGAPADGWVDVQDVDWRDMPGSSVMGVIPGDCFSLKDMLYGLMLPSGNDAALAIARYQAGSDEAFVGLMNTLMGKLGLTDSHFTDPHGLGSNSHRMSAYDIAMISRYAMLEHSLFREIVGARSWTANGDREVTLRNVNSFFGHFEGADGIKTGFTEQAGRTLAASAVRNGHRLYAVILNDDKRYEDASALFKWAFDNFTWP